MGLGPHFDSLRPLSATSRMGRGGRNGDAFVWAEFGRAALDGHGRRSTAVLWRIGPHDGPSSIVAESNRRPLQNWKLII